jgi:hypothetical protein
MLRDRFCQNETLIAARISRGSCRLLFVADAAYLVVNTLVTTPRESLIGLSLIALGIPLYIVRVRRR